ncbi:MAG: HD family phosphohydrolase, partial [Nitrospirota bacterium]
MLADAVEAASRVLDDPTPQRISALVEKIVNRFFEDGQLTECELTFKDLTAITRSFNMLLSGIYHHRIDYPGLGIPSGGKKVAGTGNKLTEENQGANWPHAEGGPPGAVVTGIRRR